jgi:phage baseplate assembly protein W
MPAQYVTQRIRKEVVESLRKYEKKHKLKPSISNTIDLGSMVVKLKFV